MATTEKVERGAGVSYAIRLSPSEDKTRPRLRLGKVTKKQADTARSHIEQLIAWSVENFADRKMLITSSFGMEGCVLIDMFAQTKTPMSIVYLSPSLDAA